MKTASNHRRLLIYNNKIQRIVVFKDYVNMGVKDRKMAVIYLKSLLLLHTILQKNNQTNNNNETTSITPRPSPSIATTTARAESTNLTLAAMASAAIVAFLTTIT